MTQLQSSADPSSTDQANANEEREPVLRIDREFDAPIEAVFDAWTDPAQLRSWWGPEGMTVPVCEMDVRKGGAYKTTMRNADGEEYTVSGVYQEIARPNRLSFTWGWITDGKRGHETLVTLRFESVGKRTRMLFEQRAFEDAEVCARHNEGWTSSFRCLDSYLTSL